MQASDILWFKLQFGRQIANAVANTPFDLDMLTAIACQETGYIWSVLRRKGLAVPEILALCVGDTLDADKGRRAFPQDKDQLCAHPMGDRMFEIARKGLVDMAKHVPGYSAAARRPNKFCHGFGIFQYDLQFFKTNPDHFLQGRYADFDACAALCVTELKRGLAKLGWAGRSNLTHYEMACVAIAYNTGGFKQGQGLKQGHKSGERYYGEDFYDYLLKAHAIVLPVEPSRPGEAVTPKPSPTTATGASYEVDTRAGLLNLRRAPTWDPKSPSDNVVAGLPDGHIVQATGSPESNGFLEVETQLAGALLRGYVKTQYLKKVAARLSAAPEISRPAGLIAVHMPRKTGTITRRSEFAGAHSLNEPGMPGRKATTPGGLVAELDAIIAYLGVENVAHTRYKPRAGLTFCNVYAHDFCHLAGAYLPRVWWTPGALVSIGQGQQISPKYGATIEEMRANALFRWLRDFGLMFGWRQTGTLTKLQQHANQGGLGVIVARRTEEGRPGHIVMVVPETEAMPAKRNLAGEVTSPVQSQAGLRNLARSAQANWWSGAQFAEHGFWIHP